jgi:L-threonylcarbamoyladenylate synthase
LKNGGLVAIPTETVYGLAGNALDERVVSRIFSAKKRPQFDPLIVHCSSIGQISHYATLENPQARLLAEKFWPGPMTLVLPKKDVVPYLVTSGMDTVAMRIPAHEMTLHLLRQLDFPLVAPSANPFGYVSPTTPDHVNDNLGDVVDYILDGGPCQLGIESTIILFDNKIPTVLRSGSLSVEKIQTIIGEINVVTHSSSNPSAPGMLKSHYAPGKKLVLGNIELLLGMPDYDRVGVLSFREKFEHPKIVSQIILSENGDLEEAATNLFSGLRSLDKMDINFILAETVPNHGLGRAINDRLKRGASDK